MTKQRVFISWKRNEDESLFNEHDISVERRQMSNEGKNNVLN